MPAAVLTAVSKHRLSAKMPSHNTHPVTAAVSASAAGVVVEEETPKGQGIMGKILSNISFSANSSSEVQVHMPTRRGSHNTLNDAVHDISPADTAAKQDAVIPHKAVEKDTQIEKSGASFSFSASHTSEDMHSGSANKDTIEQMQQSDGSPVTTIESTAPRRQTLSAIAHDDSVPKGPHVTAAGKQAKGDRSIFEVSKCHL